ncbi:hypothetical protein [Bacillus sp. AFS040349]|uniref:hypothetical protein n=1 Tax=Bacillus sp. AFS040349 TaxID=2033502 RepID=UPI000BFDC92B|nr:hypothetical protein [Bacillus sp. AFS040349]PGT82211.1 hypothetical protein COD11_15560 [Bacillus sp. AFS040349]
MEVDIREYLENIFKEDPLRLEISKSKLDKYLYTKEILGMHPEKQYSTIEAAAIIGRSDSTIRNYFRTDLLGYIRPDKQGKFYRLNYISVFKLHMILLLLEKGDKATGDLTDYLGITDSITEVKSDSDKGRYNKGGNPNLPGFKIDDLRNEIKSELKDELKALKKIILTQNSQFQNQSNQNQLSILENDEKTFLHEIEAIDQKIEMLKMKQQNKVIESKYYKVLDHSLRQTKAGSGKKKGFLASLFGGSDKDEVNIEQVMKEAMIAAEQVASSLSDSSIEKEISVLEELKLDKQRDLDKVRIGINDQKEQIKVSAQQLNYLTSDEFDDELVDKLLLNGKIEE